MSVVPKIQQVLQTTRSGRLHFRHDADTMAVESVAAGLPFRGQTVVFTDPLLDLLLALAGGGRTTILSLYRGVRGGPHGQRINGEMVCSAVDIAAYDGLNVNLHDRQNAIRVVSNVIRRFPAGVYDLGFPRPVGGPGGFDASHDVFFPVTDAHTARRCYDGNIALPMNRMLEPARSEILRAMSASPGTFRTQYPDGLNHLHIKVKNA